MISRSLTLTVAATATALATFASPAASQRIDSPYEFVETSQGLRGTVAYIFPSGGVLDLGPEAAPAFGLGYNLRVSGAFNLDARALYFATTRPVYDTEPADSAALRNDPTLGLVNVGESAFDLLLLDASLRFDLTGPRTFYRMQPYALVGIGGALRVSDEDDVPAEEGLEPELRVRFQNGFTGHVGAGIEAHLTERLTLRFDARDVLWKLHVPEGFFVPGRVIDDEEWVQNAILGLGLVFRF